jgi:uncharacterized protein YdaU (DUF1376 family)
VAELPILPLKTDALIADTTHMSAEEFGAYCRILFAMWRNKARLPDDATELARIAGVSMKRWQTISARVTKPLTVGNGTISQKRLTATWLDVQEVRRKRALSANMRWGKVDANGMQMHVHSHSKRNAKAMLTK